MDRGVVSDCDEVWHGLIEAIEIAAKEQDLVVAVATVETIAQRGNERALGSFDQRKFVGNDLENVVATFAEEQIAGLPVQAAGDDVVARPAKNPLFSRTTGKNIPAGT